MSEPLVPIEGAFTSLFDAVSKPPQWVIEDLLPVGLTIIGGPPKDAKKSTLVLACAALVADYPCKVLPPEFKVAKGGSAMLYSYEADVDEIKNTACEELLIQPRDDNGIIVCDTPEEFLLDDPQGVDQLFAWLDGRKPRLVVIDPLRNAHSLDEKDSGELVRILIPLRRWAKKHDAAVVVVHHTKKLEEEKTYTAMELRGSSALFGLADGVIMITPKPEPMQFVYKCTFKRGKGWERTLQLAGYETKNERAGEALRAAHKPIIKALEQLGDPGLRMADIADQTNNSMNTTGRLLQELAERGHVMEVKDGKGTRWQLTR